MPVNVKICGLKRPEEIDAAAKAGARYIGFVSFRKSPRHLDSADMAELAAHVPPGIAKVLLSVDASDEELERILSEAPIDILQLQGSETPDRVAAVKSKFGLPVMKAVGCASREDLKTATRYSDVADQILLDAKPVEGSDRPGGNGLAFDWQILSGHKWTKPWMLAGGLTPENVADAIQRTGTQQVDVSSGVESAPGLKSIELIKRFLSAANSASR